MNTRDDEQKPVVNEERRGGIMVLSAGLLVLVFAFTAFAVDIGHITLTRAQLQKSADAAALAAVIEMYDGWGHGKTLTSSEILAAARGAAVDVAASNEAGGLAATYLDAERDVRLGQLQWNEETQTWEKKWGESPYNLVEVTARRDQTGSANGDKSLDLFFARVLGHHHAKTRVISTSAMLPGVGLRNVPGKKVMLLPFALDQETWDRLIQEPGEFDDEFSYDPDTGEVTRDSDGVHETTLFPYGNHDLPPGNRGTIDLGSPDNSTATVKRQILYGLNDEDLSYYGGELRFDDLPMDFNGNTGISAGMESEMKSIIGEIRLIPIFSDVSGPGNNAWFTIEKFVPVRILYVQLTGSPTNKRIVIQPAPYVDATVVAGETVITENTIFAPASLVQ